MICSCCAGLRRTSLSYESFHMMKKINDGKKGKRDFPSIFVRLIIFSVFWYIFGILARMGVEAMEHHFTKVLSADQLLDMKVTLPMVMGVLSMSVTQFIAKKTGYDQ